MNASSLSNHHSEASSAQTTELENQKVVSQKLVSACQDMQKSHSIFYGIPIRRYVSDAYHHLKHSIEATNWTIEKLLPLRLSSIDRGGVRKNVFNYFGNLTGPKNPAAMALRPRIKNIGLNKLPSDLQAIVLSYALTDNQLQKECLTRYQKKLLSLADKHPEALELLVRWTNAATGKEQEKIEIASTIFSPNNWLSLKALVLALKFTQRATEFKDRNSDRGVMKVGASLEEVAGQINIQVEKIENTAKHLLHLSEKIDQGLCEEKESLEILSSFITYNGALKNYSKEAPSLRLKALRQEAAYYSTLPCSPSWYAHFLKIENDKSGRDENALECYKMAFQSFDKALMALENGDKAGMALQEKIAEFNYQLAAGSHAQNSSVTEDALKAASYFVEEANNKVLPGDAERDKLYYELAEWLLTQSKALINGTINATDSRDVLLIKFLANEKMKEMAEKKNKNARDTSFSLPTDESLRMTLNLRGKIKPAAYYYEEAKKEELSQENKKSAQLYFKIAEARETYEKASAKQDHKTALLQLEISDTLEEAARFYQLAAEREKDKAAPCIIGLYYREGQFEEEKAIALAEKKINSI